MFSPLEDLNIAVLVGDSPVGLVLAEGAVGLEIGLLLVWVWAVIRQRSPMQPCQWWQPAAVGAVAAAAAAGVATAVQPAGVVQHWAGFGVALLLLVFVLGQIKLNSEHCAPGEHVLAALYIFMPPHALKRVAVREEAEEVLDE